MDHAVAIAFLKGVALFEETADTIAIEAPMEMYRQRMTLTGATPGLRAALKQLQNESVPPPVLMAQVLQTDGMMGLGRLNQFLKKLEQFTLLQRQLIVDGVPFASIRPLSIYYRYEENKIDPEQRYVMSRFAYVRNEQNGLVLECPLGYARIECHAPAVLTVLHALGKPCKLADLVRAEYGLQQEGVRILMNFLASAQALAPVDDRSVNPENVDAALAPWEFHDLLFHTRSRLGRHDRPYGGTFPFKDKLPQLPVIKKPMSDRVIPLYRPDIEELKKSDLTFTDVLERRSSLREHGKPPINVQQLGEFLFRTARVKWISEEGGVSFRPYPGGGALHELEIYPLVDRCDGLEPGLYNYNPLRHELYHVSGPNLYVNTLLKLAGHASKLESSPQILLIVSARFQRMQHKYQSMTYSVILKNVGALYQTMYLVATAMGLAPCALGGGHADLFAQAAGLNYLEETSVGEFMLGSRGSVAPKHKQPDYD